MEATQLFSSAKIFRQPFSPYLPGRRRHAGAVVKARREYWVNNVDENMIVLRKRIKEMKMIETANNDDGDSDHWMQWEKQYFVHYNEDVCEAVGLLQNYLLNTRPCLGLGTLAVVIFSVLISTGVLFSLAFQLAMGILSG